MQRAAHRLGGDEDVLGHSHDGDEAEASLVAAQHAFMLGVLGACFARCCCLGQAEALSGQGDDCAVEREIIEHAPQGFVRAFGQAEAGGDFVDVQGSGVLGEHLSDACAAELCGGRHGAFRLMALDFSCPPSTSCTLSAAKGRRL